MARARRIGILTGGGDVPGSQQRHQERRLSRDRAGLRGLRHPPRLGGPDPPAARVPTLTAPMSCRSTASPPGPSTAPVAPVLHTSRTNPRKMRADRLPAHLAAARAATMTDDGETYDLTPVVLENIERLGLDYLVPIGGDDTLSASPRRCTTTACRSSPSPRPWTTTSRAPSTASASRPPSPAPRRLINRQRTTLGSHERIGVFRIFGRDCGFTALYTAYVTSARCLIPEAPFDLDHLARLLAEDQRQQPEPLRLRHRRRGRDLVGRHDPGGRRGRRLRPSAQGQHRGGPGGRDQGRGPASRPCSPS